MARVLVPYFTIAFLIIVPITAPAQGFNALCDTADGCKAPSGIVPTAAWVHSFNTHYGIDEGLGMTFAERTGDWAYNYDAFQIGLALPISLGDEGRFGTFVVGGTVAIPSSAQGEEIFTNGGSPPATLHARKWTADTYYATAEGLWAYPVLGDWIALAGFRWVYWQTTYTNPFDVRGSSLPTDTADVTVNAYLPLLGIMSKMGGLTVGAVGFPTALGDVTHYESFNGSNSHIKVSGGFDGGYIAEVFVDYAVSLQDSPILSSAFSAFSKAAFLTTEGVVKLEQTLTGISEEYDFRLQRNLLFLGAKGTINFDIAGLVDLLY